ncbi:MAG: pyruvate dehydrogenase complex dihydrolipoamide acetyltransferase [Ascidiaceihabitans sp.]|jgi:pyruvate dehydrogenase E2 component (dihydrolipoamide acetyltransferase)|nr:pyruvate dehydrogenase complex dihydrolipoamide acetyltransferase [Ascidiaceihabitans sp.]
MPIEILMPALSPTMEEGTLAKWLVKEGDTVSSGDLLAEIETDKATMEFEAVDEGVVGKIMVAEGTEGVKVNAVIAVLLEDGESASDMSTAAAEAPAAAPTTAPVAEAAAPAAVAPTPAPAAPAAKDGNRVFASPLARRIAADKGVDLTTMTGSGPRGRIVKADVEGASATPAAVSAPAPATVAMPASASADAVAKIYEDREYTEIPLNGMRKTIAARLTEAKQTVPHFYLRRDINLDALLSFRGELNKQLAARDVKLSINDFIIKACALALQSVPDANAVWAGDRVFNLKPSDVAVAVAIEGGLFTPVLKDAEVKSLSTLSAEMKDLATRAKDRKLAPDEYQGGSFAISNLGMFGIDNFDAVINPPHGAILAVGAGKKKAIVGPDGDLVVATVMSVTLSVDHRVIDGALGALLLNAIVDNLENPMGMLA